MQAIEIELMMKTNARRMSIFALSLFAFLLVLSSQSQAKKLDPYKDLGVDKNASQREIQKAFHKLSLQYHPDKNKNKGAQQKFEEINNAYEILSDEEKRKNYDLYGDERGTPGFDAGGPGDQGGYTYFTGGGGPGGQGGYTYFTGGGPRQSQFTFRPGGWQTMGGPGGSKSFSFPFGNPGGGGGSNSFGFDLNDIFSDLFGGGFRGGSQFGGFKGATGSKHGSMNSATHIKAVNSRVFKKEITDQGMTWVLLLYTPTSRGTQLYESIIDEVAGSLQGALKAGTINCEAEHSLCEDLGIIPHRAPRVFIYSYRSSDTGSLVEYNGDAVAKSLKSFCQEHLPRFSKRVDLKHFDLSSGSKEGLPTVMLLSTKKDTPVIWRVLSGIYCNRIRFYDAEVQDVSDSRVKKLGVDALPAIVGWLSNGEKHVLKTGISVKDLKSAVSDLSALLESFLRNYKKSASTQSEQSHTEKKQIPILSGSNFNALCGDKAPVCIIGAFRSLKAREKLEAILLAVSQKTLSRQQNQYSKDPISYTLLDATKQSAFLKAFDKSAFKSLDNFLVAYKPRKRKFSTFAGDMTIEEVERFISSVLNGDIQFKKTIQKPVLN